MKIATLYADIRPSTTGFSAQAKAELNPIMAGLGKFFRIPVHADTQPAQVAIGALKSSVSSMLGVAGLTGTVYGAIKLSQQAIGEARGAEVAQRRVNLLYGSSAELVNKWAESSIESMGMMDDEAKMQAASLAQYMLDSGLSEQQMAEMTTAAATRMADIASVSGHSYEDVVTAFDSAIRGRVMKLKEFLGVELSEADVTAKARELGLLTTTVDDRKVAEAKQRVVDIQNELNKATTGGAASAADMTVAQNNLTIAQDRYARAKKGTAEELAAQNAVITATERLNDLRSKGQPDQAKVAKLTQELAWAQDDYNTALGGTADAMTPAVRAQAFFAVLMEKSAGWAGRFGETSADAALKSGARWREALETIGKAIDPLVIQLQTELSGWLKEHQQDIARFAHAAADALKELKDIIQWMADHKEVLELIAGLLVLGRVGGVFGNIARLPGLGMLAGGGAVVAGGAGSAATTAAAATAARNVTTSAVATTAAAAAATQASKVAVTTAQETAATVAPLTMYTRTKMTQLGAAESEAAAAGRAAGGAPIVAPVGGASAAATAGGGVGAGLRASAGPAGVGALLGFLTGSPDVGLSTATVMSVLGKNWVGAGLFAAPLAGEWLAKQLFGAPDFKEAGSKLGGQMTIEGTPASEDMYRAQKLAAKGEGRKAGELFFADWPRLLESATTDELDKILAFVQGQVDHRTTQLKLMEESYVKKVTGKAPMEYAPPGTALAPYGQQGLIEAQAMLAAGVDKKLINAWLTTYIEDLQEHPGATTREDVEKLQQWAQDTGLDVANEIGAAAYDFARAVVGNLNQATLNMNQIFALQQQATAWYAAIALDPTRGWSAPNRPTQPGGTAISKQHGGYLPITGFFYGHQGEYVETAAEARMRTRRNDSVPVGDTYNVNTYYPSADVDVVTSVRRAARLGRSRERRIAPPHQWAPTLRVK